MKETEKAYIAGFIDGEGNISLIKATNNESRNGFALASVICITNTDLYVLNYIQKILKSGHIHISDSKNPLHKAKCVLQIRKQSEVKFVLNEIKKYLVIKKEQAELLLNFCENREKQYFYTDKDFEIWEKMRTLNNKGCYTQEV